MENNDNHDLEDIKYTDKKEELNEIEELKKENKQLRGCLKVVIGLILIGVIGFSVCLASF